MVVQGDEVEDKYDVGADFALPDLTVDPVDRIESATYDLDAVYFDTADSALRRHAITLRRRTGGHDAGWHLKLPAGSDRTELRVDSNSTAVPKELSSLLLGIRRDQKLVPTVTISTTRVASRLLTADGGLLAEVAYDTVHATSSNQTRVEAGSEPASVLTQWREVEVELGDAGDRALLALIGRRLTEVGAERSPSVSKAGRALGEPTPVVRPTRLAGLVDDYLQTQYAAIVDGDLALRRELNVIHKTRVAVRRVRSTVKTYGALFDTAAADELEAELVWYAALLGEVRDLDVQRKRLGGLVQELPAELVVGPVAARIESDLATRRATKYRNLRRAMNGKRYLALLVLLDRWRVDPPWTDAAAAPKKGAAKYVAKAEKKMGKRLRLAAEPGAHDGLLHRARKAEKRYRYACELAQSVLGKRTEQAIDDAKALQTLLGEFQDSVVCSAMLRQMGTRAGSTAGENGFTYGLLFAQQWEAKRATRAQVISEYR